MIESYIGPGLGIGAIAAALGFILSLSVLIFGIVWHPIKTAIRKFKTKQATASHNSAKEKHHSEKR